MKCRLKINYEIKFFIVTIWLEKAKNVENIKIIHRKSKGYGYFFLDIVIIRVYLIGNSIKIFLKNIIMFFRINQIKN